MKNLKIYLKPLLFTAISGSILINVGCTQNNKSIQNKENLTNSTIVNNETVTSEIPTITTAVATTVVIEKIPDKALEKIAETTQEYKFANESEAVSYLNKLPNDINSYIEKEDYEKAKQYAIDKFIMVVDFICYDKEIGGIKFSDLTDNAKKDVIVTANVIDELISKKFPNYKEEIKNKTGIAYDYLSNLIVTKKNELEGYIISTIGEDDYALFEKELEEVNQDTKDTVNMIVDEGEKVLEKIKNKYEEFRDSNN